MPEFMTGIIDRCVEKYRPILLRNNTQESAFWISSTTGTQFTTKNMGTLEHFPFSLHHNLRR